jgi:hypothetical protein
MSHPDTPFIFDLKKDNVSKIEHFVDFISSQLLINDTYTGNILVSLSEFFNLAKAVSLKGKMNISYSTDYQKINILIQPIDNQLSKELKNKIEVEDTETSSIHKSLYLLRALIDKIEVIDGNSISLSFDISAVHNKVYAHRQNALNLYFTQSGVKLTKSNDSF